MTRPLTEHAFKAGEGDGAGLASALQHTGRAFAAAVSALMVAALVVGRTEIALRPDGVGTDASVTSGVVSLRDDDEGAALFDLDNLTPSQEVSRCITVIYDGTALPAELAFMAEVDGELAPFLNTTITTGTAGGFKDCSSFEADSELYNGPLDGLTPDDPLLVGEFFNTGESMTFRIDLRLADDSEAMGRSVSVGFRWEATVR